MWYALIANLALVGLVISAWAHVGLIVLVLPGRRTRVATFGGVMGLGAVLSMLLSVELQSGVFFDLRSMLIGVGAGRDRVTGWTTGLRSVQTRFVDANS